MCCVHTYTYVCDPYTEHGQHIQDSDITHTEQLYILGLTNSRNLHNSFPFSVFIPLVIDRVSICITQVQNMFSTWYVDCNALIHNKIYKFKIIKIRVAGFATSWYQNLFKFFWLYLYFFPLSYHRQQNILVLNSPITTVNILVNIVQTIRRVNIRYACFISDICSCDAEDRNGNSSGTLSDIRDI